MSTPFTQDLNQRSKHLSHLQKLLKNPFCLTRQSFFDDFTGSKSLRLIAIENLNMDLDSGLIGVDDAKSTVVLPPSTEIAVLMLTSGSTGNAKAVVLSHRQIIASVSGKSSVKQLPTGSTFLNWVGLDHVASLVEVHLQALYLCVDQIHVPAADLIADPTLFLNLIHRYRVSRSFAPNFFLAKLKNELQNKKESLSYLDLSCLRFLASGGEANPVETCDALSKLLRVYGAPRTVITPGFGMTETCAGAIYNVKCPNRDLRNGREFAAVGNCIPGITMRITSQAQPNTLAEPSERGNLEVAGPVVFKEYFNDEKATVAAFTSDGWFRTGDQAYIDVEGNLVLAGRGKEQMIINGVKYSPHEVETAIEEASIPGVTSTYIVCFSYRSPNSPTEQICVVYLPAYSADDHEAHLRASEAIARLVMLQTSVRPYVLPLNNDLLQKSTLGKFARSKIRTAFETGEYRKLQEFNEEILSASRALNTTPPTNKMEEMLLQEFEETVGLRPQEFGTERQVFEMGVTSVDLIKVTRAIERRLMMSGQIPISTMMTHPTVRSLAIALSDLDAPKEYNPVVTLQHNGTTKPLWLIHPGVGEVLVFINLAKYFPDRPIYALRARGFNAGEFYFTNIAETVEIYHSAIKRIQPTGPYALAGYSYGSMLAFETAKVFESNGDTVAFLGSFNLPPHIKARMQQLDWNECLINLAYFLDLMTEPHAHSLSPILHNLDRSHALAHVMGEASPARISELSLTPEALSKWAGLAYSLQSMAKEYEPSGMVERVDVFYCIPLRAVAKTKEEWLANHLSKWDGFVKSKPRFHEVGGSHYTMIGPEHVGGFQKVLRGVLKERGL